MNRLLSYLGLLAVVAISPTQVLAKADSPASVAGAVTIDTEKAKQLFMANVKFLDIRSYSDWDAGRIPQAIHIELKKEFNELAMKAVISVNEPVVIYCNSLKCHRSYKASKKAVSWGYKEVYYYRTGYPAWKNAKNPIE